MAKKCITRYEWPKILIHRRNMKFGAPIDTLGRSKKHHYDPTQIRTGRRPSWIEMGKSKMACFWWRRTKIIVASCEIPTKLKIAGDHLHTWGNNGYLLLFLTNSRFSCNNGANLYEVFGVFAYFWNCSRLRIQSRIFMKFESVVRLMAPDMLKV